MILEMKNIVKTYGRVVANDNVSIDLNEGEILAIVGENGAGKSTIMKILYGLEKPDSGEIYVRGRKVSFSSPSEAMKLGIGMVQQHFMLFGPMTVTENIVYNNEQQKYGFLDKKKNIEKVRELSEKYGLEVDPNAVIRDCSVGTQQRVEILKTLYQNADTIIFDEPSAVLTPGEVDDLLKTMKNLARAGKSLIIITHKLNEVMEVADRVVVMRAGKVVGRVNKADTSPEELSYMMIGRQLMNLDIKPVEKGRTLLSVSGLSMGSESGKKVLNDVNLHVDEGEIAGGIINSDFNKDERGFFYSAVNLMHDVTEGGVYGASYEMAHFSGIGITIDEKEIPISPATSEICSALGLDPYRLISSGSLLMATSEADRVLRKLGEKGIKASVIGEFTEGSYKLRKKNGEMIDLAPPAADEIYKL